MNAEFSNQHVGSDGLIDVAFDHSQQEQRNIAASLYPYSAATQHNAATTAPLMPNTTTWSIPMSMTAMSSPQAQASSVSDEQQASSPLSHASSPHSHHSSLQHSPFSQHVNPLTDWALQHQQAAMAAQQQQQHLQQQQFAQPQQHQQQHQQHQHQHQHFPSPEMSQFIQDPAMAGYNAFPGNFPQPNPLDYLPATTQATLQASLMEPTFGAMAGLPDASQALQWGGSPELGDWQDLQSTLQMEALARNGSVGSNSPTNTYLEVLSLSSSSGENSWAMVDWNRQGLEQFQQTQNAAIFNPSQTLHLRSDSNSSDGANSLEFGSFEEIQPFPFSPFSPESDGHADHSHGHSHGHNHGHNHATHRNCYSSDGQHHSHEAVSPTDAARSTPIKVEPVVSRHSPGRASGAGSSSPPTTSNTRRNSAPRKMILGKTTTKTILRRTSNGKKDGSIEKKVGKRKGPLLPEQRKQASEIRKLRACLRCKFLKKTCDPGEPCNGCQPSHARLWQVPCTRIDIKDIGYFMKDWKADYEMHMDRNVTIFNVKGFDSKETLMWITHGYGFALPVMVRQVYVADESCLSVEWVESYQADDPIDFETRTERLDVGREGVNLTALSEYLDKHIEGPFEHFIDDHFEGTPFITEILKTAHRFYMKERMPVICKALKLVLAYNLTVHITMVENQGSESSLDGVIDDEDSKFFGRTVAPVMINFQIKCALADMWRELQKDILEELSSLYSGVYSGEKMKNWPTIFMLASILLAVWEEVQFDSHYRVPDQAAVDKFCNDMETTPVGVIIGLFHAISQKLPAFVDWDTEKHGHLLHNNTSVCEAMTEVRDHVIKHGKFLFARRRICWFA